MNPISNYRPATPLLYCNAICGIRILDLLYLHNPIQKTKNISNRIVRLPILVTDHLFNVINIYTPSLGKTRILPNEGVLYF